MVDEVALFYVSKDDTVTVGARGTIVVISIGEGWTRTTGLSPESAAKIGRALLRAAEHVAPQQVV